MFQVAVFLALGTFILLRFLRLESMVPFNRWGRSRPRTQRSRAKGPGFWCRTLSPHLRPPTGLPSTGMGTRTLGESSLPWTLPVFGRVPRDGW